jgi:beta-lactamase superfamily II metal-dependent hydrolase
MALKKNKDYFISQPSVVLRSKAKAKSDPINHLIFGDWLRWLGETKNNWQKVRCRNDEGWIRTSEFHEARALEINLVDIGQGDSVHLVTPDDKVMLIDAGKTSNLFRFLHWRYNLRDRKVAGVDGVTASDPKAKGPFPISQVVISHPDKDHYYGFMEVFECPKLSIANVYHNSIVERPISQAEKDAVKAKDGVKHYSNDDLGRYVAGPGKVNFIWDVVRSNKEIRDLIKKHENTQKLYLKTLLAAIENPANKGLKFKSLSVRDEFFPGHDEANDVTIKLLGPVPEDVTFEGETRPALRRLGAEGISKNGHSVVMLLGIGRLRVLLGGDLNTEAEDYLLRHYCGVDDDASELEKIAYHLRHKGPDLSNEEQQELAVAEASLASIVTKARQHFQVDVTKACHHGSHHFSETFLKALNAIAVVISSGDRESYSHPRPDALGAFGKYGRGHQPLIFSTEIARSTREFTPIYKYFKRLEKYQADLKAATTDTEKKRIQKEIEGEKDSNVAKYGMITVRTDGDTVIIAQKIEEPDSEGEKWDIHQLEFNTARGQFEYRDRTKHH